MSKKQKKPVDKIIFVAGSGLTRSFIRYVAGLTGKPDPRICFIPAATGDNPVVILDWYANCEDLPVRPFVLRTFINSTTTDLSFHEQIMSMDAIVVGGGNTLNMIALWKVHGIDKILRKAYNKGIVLSGGSAGSLCWFSAGSTDSRPKKLSIVEGLHFLKFSHSPHYHKEPARRPLYHQLILSNKLRPGFACDDQAGLLFVNGSMKKSISLNDENNNYFVSVKNGNIHEKLLPAEIII